MNTVFEFIGILVTIVAVVFMAKLAFDYEAREAAKRAPVVPSCPTVEVEQDFPTYGVVFRIKSKRPACVWA